MHQLSAEDIKRHFDRLLGRVLRQRLSGLVGRRLHCPAVRHVASQVRRPRGGPVARSSCRDGPGRDHFRTDQIFRLQSLRHPVEVRRLDPPRALSDIGGRGEVLWLDDADLRRRSRVREQQQFAAGQDGRVNADAESRRVLGDGILGHQGDTHDIAITPIVRLRIAGHCWRQHQGERCRPDSIDDEGAVETVDGSVSTCNMTLATQAVACANVDICCSGADVSGCKQPVSRSTVAVFAVRSAGVSSVYDRFTCSATER